MVFSSTQSDFLLLARYMTLASQPIFSFTDSFINSSLCFIETKACRQDSFVESFVGNRRACAGTRENGRILVFL